MAEFVPASSVIGAATSRPPVRRFYVGMALAAIVATLIGFGPKYYLRVVDGSVAASTLVHVHAAVFSSWLLLLFAQATLASVGKVNMHRQMGLLGGALAILMVGLGVLVAVQSARAGRNPGGPFNSPLEFMIVPLTDLAIFAPLVAAAFWFRRRPELHRRLIILATIGGLLPAPFARIAPGNVVALLGFLALFLLAAPVRDRLAGRRPHHIDVWGGLLVLVSVPLRAAVAKTGAWHIFAEWLVR